MGIEVTSGRMDATSKLRRASRWAWASMLASTLLPTLGPFAHADESDPEQIAVIAQAGGDNDTDGFSGNLFRAGVLLDYTSYFQHAGIAVQNTRYSLDGWSKDVPGVVGIYRSQRRDTLEGIRAEAGLVSVGGHTRVVGDATWSYRPRASTGLELVAAGDLVGTREALRRAIAFGVMAASVEQQISGRLTAIGFLGWQPFTDGNSRTLARGRLIFGLLPEQGLSLQLRWRQYASSEEDVGRAYFNPEQYRNGDVVLSLRRRVNGWTVSALGGIGREQSNEAPWNDTVVAEVRLEGPLHGDVRLAFNTLYSRAAGFVDSPDYWYGTLGLSVIVPFDR